MWLLKLHFAISILCWLTFLGFRTIFKETIKENGYEISKKPKAIHWIFFIPILNIATVLVLFVEITITKQDLDKWCEEQKKKKDERRKQK